MTKSKTRIEKQITKKTNSELVETIIASKKNESWRIVASLLSGPSRKRANKNLEEIEKEVKEGEIIVVPGKVLSGGELNKKVKLVGFSFSDRAVEKLKKNKIEHSLILDEIKRNKDAKGVRILK